MRVLIGFVLVLLTAGCLQTEVVEIRILREGGEPAVIVIEEENLYSDETDTLKVREDFDRLIKNWRADESVKEMADEAMLIRARELFVRDGKIVFRQTGILKTLNSPDDGILVGDAQITWTLEGNDEIAETNGKITEGSRTIVWPKDARELRVKLRQPLKGSANASQPQMMQLLKEHLAAEAR